MTIVVEAQEPQWELEGNGCCAARGLPESHRLAVVGKTEKNIVKDYRARQ